MSPDTVPRLPPLHDILAISESDINIDALNTSLSILFEPSSILTSAIAPRVRAVLEHRDRQTTVSYTYTDLVDATISVVHALPLSDQATFIGGHPRIGESNNLSALSAAEQARVATPPEVLARLGHLNACYERKYPGLVYITFVNGRSRAQIVEEMESHLGIERSTGGITTSSTNLDQPPLEDRAFEPLETEGQGWAGELRRAVDDVGRIAKSRVATLGAL
jgi:2-oxo-4-hydroxy-4-carboxy--5-ureidoimidazoline (OHCU) decarboxylase